MSNNQTQGGARARVAIIGAGAIGLGIAWKLAREGCAVTVYDQAEAGRAASWASGGMLAGGIETEPGEERLWRLATLSQRLWLEQRDLIQADSGLDIGYRDEGSMVVALNRDDLEQLRFTYEFQTGLGIELQWLNGAQAREREPYLHAGTAAAVYSRSDHQIDNRALVEALKAAVVRLGGVLREHCPVAGVELTGGRVSGVRVGDAVEPAEVVVVAAGAWSRLLEGLPEAVRPPVRPIRGQLIYLRMNPDEPVLRHVLWAPKAYLIPRRDGRLLIGATTEERGFVVENTAGGVYALLDGAWRAIPAIEELPLAELVVGFRPGSRDDAPILGPTAVEGLVMATGHHRNGILLGAVTTEAISRYVLTGEVMDAIRDYTLDRFQR